MNLEVVSLKFLERRLCRTDDAATYKKHLSAKSVPVVPTEK